MSTRIIRGKTPCRTCLFIRETMITYGEPATKVNPATGRDGRCTTCRASRRYHVKVLRSYRHAHHPWAAAWMPFTVRPTNRWHHFAFETPRAERPAAVWRRKVRHRRSKRR